ncbi:MAG: hypothetical protein GY906_37050 [bacterium]|nr:hypothetical protein [bacterium]
MLLQILIDPGKDIGAALAGIGQALPGIIDPRGSQRQQGLQALTDPVFGEQIGKEFDALTEEVGEDDALTATLIRLGQDPSNKRNRDILGAAIKSRAAGLTFETRVGQELAQAPEAVSEAVQATRSQTRAAGATGEAQSVQSLFAQNQAQALIDQDLPKLQAAQAAAEANLGAENAQLFQENTDAIRDLAERDPAFEAMIGSVGREGVAQLLLLRTQFGFELAQKKLEAGQGLDPIDVARIFLDASKQRQEITTQMEETTDPETVQQSVAQLNRINEVEASLLSAAGLSPAQQIPIAVGDETGLFGNKGKFRVTQVDVPRELDQSLIPTWQNHVQVGTEVMAKGGPEEFRALADASPFVQSLSPELRQKYIDQVNEVFGVLSDIDKGPDEPKQTQEEKLKARASLQRLRKLGDADLHGIIANPEADPLQKQQAQEVLDARRKREERKESIRQRVPPIGSGTGIF